MRQQWSKWFPKRCILKVSKNRANGYARTGRGTDHERRSTERPVTERVEGNRLGRLPSLNRNLEGLPIPLHCLRLRGIRREIGHAAELLGRPATAAIHAAEIRKPHCAGVSKSEIPHRVQVYAG